MIKKVLFGLCFLAANTGGASGGSKKNRLKGDYSAAGKDALYAEITARRAERSGEGFDGVTSKSTRDEMVAALEADDKTAPVIDGGPVPSGPADVGVGKAGKTADDGKGDPQPEKRTGAHPKNKHVPEAVLGEPMPPKPTGDVGATIATSPTVEGDAELIILDVINNAPVVVTLIEGKGLTKGQIGNDDGLLIFVESNIVHDLMTAERAKNKFVIREDGTVLYAQRGHDVAGATAQPGGRKFQFIDIAQLILGGGKAKK